MASLKMAIRAAGKNTTAENKTRGGMRGQRAEEVLEAAAALRRSQGLRAGLRRATAAGLAASGALRLAADCLGLAPPLAVYALVRQVQAPPTVGAPFADRYFGWAVGAALFLASALRAMCLHLHRRLASREAARARSALAMLVLDKALTLSAQATRAAGDAPAVVALSTVEPSRVGDLIASIHSLWAAPIQLALGTVLLARLLNVRSALAGIAALVLLVSPAAALLRARAAALTRHALALADHRAVLLTELFTNIRVVKMCAWEPPLLARIDAVRGQELQFLRAAVVWRALQRTLTLFQAGPAIAAVSAFSVFVSVQTAPLTPERAFPAVVLLTILQAPIAEVPAAVAAAVAAQASMRRIETFLSLEEFKSLPHTAPARPPTATPSSPTRPHPDDPPFELRSAVFRLDPPPSKTLRTISSRDLTSSASGPSSLLATRLSVAIPRGKLTLVVGAPGSGKSTLLAALVGELAPESGFVNLPRPGTVSFAPQTPLIMAGTSVRANVLFGASLDQKWLDAVLQACELDAIVASLPNGLSTVISDAEDEEEGLWTPDEQEKQRLALARAVYAWGRSELVVIDDALSSVEAPDAVRMLRRCLVDADALLAGTTRVLAVDAVANISALELTKAADWVVVMDHHKVVQAGSFADLSTLQPSGKLAQLMAALEAKKEAEEAASGAASEDGRQRGSHAGSDRRRSLSALAVWPEDPECEAPWTAYSAYWSASGPLVAAGAFGVLVSAQLSAVSMDLWLASWTSDASPPPSQSSSPPAALMLVGLPIYAYLGVSTLVLACLGDVVAHYAALRASKHLHARLLRRLATGSMRFFDSAPIDRVLSRFSTDTAAIDHSLAPAVAQRVTSALVLTSMLVVVVSVAPLLLLALLAPVLALYIPLSRRSSLQLRTAGQQETDASRGAASTTKQTLQGVATIRVFDMAMTSRKQLAARVAAAARASTRWTALACLLDSQLDILGAVFTLLIVIVVASRRPDDVTSGLAGLALAYATYAPLVLGQLTHQVDAVPDAMRSVQHVRELSSARLVDTEPLWLAPAPRLGELPQLGSEPTPLRSAVLALRPQWPEHGQLNLINVSVTPSAGSQLLGPQPVLRGVSLAVRGGAKVGLCAVDGSVSAARALLAALFRLQPTSGGRLELDGVPTAQLDLGDLRSRLAVVPRAPLLFAGESLRFNLDPAARHSDDQLWTVVRAAGLDKGRALALDASCPAEDDDSGWGRRLWLARALLRRPRVLCVNAADGVDDDLAEVARGLEQLRETTVLAVARRAAALADFDQVVVLDEDGRVAEHGSPPRLLREHPRGAFAGLLDAADDWAPTV